MLESLQTVGWVVLFMVLAGVAGIALVVAASAFVPRLLNNLSKKVDEEAEIAKGNQAVASYFGKVVSAVILAIAIVVSAALVGGVLLLK